MNNVESFSFIAAMVSLGISLTLLVWTLIVSRREITKNQSENKGKIRQPKIGVVATIIMSIGLALLTVSIISRAIVTGHGPFSNMYEFSMAFSWGILVAVLYFQYRYQTQILSIIGIVVALGFLIYAFNLPSRPVPLMPALQQSALLTAHVTSAILAYGAFTIGFGAAIVYLVQRRLAASWLPKLEVLDSIGYHSVIIGFPLMTLLIILGALWADVAWGKYWSWDPKETASLVTWLIYAGYLHARLLRGWRGTKTAILLIIGFAAVLFTFLGNYIFVGLHSYR